MEENGKLWPTRLRERGIDLLSLKATVAAANFGMPSGAVVQPSGGQMLSVETGEFLTSAEDVAGLVVGVHNGKPVYLREVARIEASAQQATRHVWFAEKDSGTHPAVTLTVTKKPGQNAVDVSSAARQRIEALRNDPRAIEREAFITAHRTGLDVAYSLEQDSWNGQRYLQLSVSDVRAVEG